jgi:hypothetical protein
VIGITSGSTTTTSAIDAVGNRVATGGGGAVGSSCPISMAIPQAPSTPPR